MKALRTIGFTQKWSLTGLDLLCWMSKDQNSLFSRFYMKIKKALELFYFRKILKFFDVDLSVLVFKRVERWVFIKFVLGLEIN